MRVYEVQRELDLDEPRRIVKSLLEEPGGHERSEWYDAGAHQTIYRKYPHISI